MSTDWTTKRQDSATVLAGPYLAAPFDPQEVDDVTLAFPAMIAHLVPHPDDIPDEFWAGNEWTALASHWFYVGIPSDTKAYMKPGRDGAACFRHLQAIKGSFAPKHEHKTAAIGFLFSQWMYGVRSQSADKTWGEVPEVQDEVQDEVGASQ